MAVPAWLACAEGRRGVRAAHDRELCRQWLVGLPVRLRGRGDGERGAPAIGPGALVRPLRWLISVASWKFVLLVDLAASGAEELLEETFGFAQTVVGEYHGFRLVDGIADEAPLIKTIE